MKGTDDELRRDGNAAAGLLGELFAFEVTTAAVTCEGCGRTAPLGAAHLYGREMGAVLRCPSCGAMMMVVTWLDGVMRLEMRAVRMLRVGARDDGR